MAFTNTVGCAKAAAVILLVVACSLLIVWMFEKDPWGYETERLEREAWGHGVERYCDQIGAIPKAPLPDFCSRRPSAALP